MVLFSIPAIWSVISRSMAFSISRTLLSKKLNQVFTILQKGLLGNFWQNRLVPSMSFFSRWLRTVTMMAFRDGLNFFRNSIIFSIKTPKDRIEHRRKTY